MSNQNNRRTLGGAILSCVLVLVFVSASGSAQDTKSDRPLQVVATLGILGDLAQQVGGDLVEVEVLSSPRQDPHYVEPRPTLMRKARDADVFLQVGLQLELWADKVISGSGNPAIQPGQAGNVVASKGVQTLELPTVLSRELGDVHPYGNPHIWLDPLNAKTMAGNMERAFAKLDPQHASDYASNLADFNKRIDTALFGPELLAKFGGAKLTRLARSGQLLSYLERRDADQMLGGWLKKALPLAGKPVVTYHKTFVYFAERFGLEVLIEVEEKPGIPPTAKHKDRVLAVMRDNHVRALLQELFFDPRAGQYLCERTDAELCEVPIDVGEGVGAQDVFELTDLLLDALLQAHSMSEK